MGSSSLWDCDDDADKIAIGGKKFRRSQARVGRSQRIENRARHSLQGHRRSIPAPAADTDRDRGV
jgi:hypothetical protein